MHDVNPYTVVDFEALKSGLDAYITYLNDNLGETYRRDRILSLQSQICVAQATLNNIRVISE